MTVAAKNCHLCNGVYASDVLPMASQTDLDIHLKLHELKKKNQNSLESESFQVRTFNFFLTRVLFTQFAV